MQRRYVIHGQVQGVFFRDSTRQKARELGVRGWVRNRSDGTVEVMAAGDEESLAALEQWFRAGGPPDAQVDRIEPQDVAEEPLDDFRVRA